MVPSVEQDIDIVHPAVVCRIDQLDKCFVAFPGMCQVEESVE